MPVGSRIRGNNSFGVITDNPLTAGATTFNSTQLSTLPVVAAAHAVVTLDPIRQFGEPEIVIVTAHTALATVATITRGAYGTTARSHPQGTVWTHAPVTEDFISILTSGTRPTDPYEGQFIFEADTNKLVGFGGVDWAPRDAGGTLGYAQVVATQSGISVEADITGLSVLVTVGTGRRIKITGKSELQQVGSAGSVVGRIKEGATNFNRFARYDAAINETFQSTGHAIITPSAGLHTYKLTLATTAGTANVIATSEVPAFILVEDIGAV